MWHHQIRLHKFWRRVLDNHVTISYKIPVILQVKLQDTFFHFFLVTWDPALFQNWLLKGETSLKPQSNPDSSLGAKIHGSFFHHLKYPSKCSYSIYCNHIRLHLVKSPLFKFKLHMSGKTLPSLQLGPHKKPRHRMAKCQPPKRSTVASWAAHG